MSAAFAERLQRLQSREGGSLKSLVLEVTEHEKVKDYAVTAIDRDPIRRALVRSLQRFCADTDIQLVAEGVETADEAESLLAVGVRFAQGFHLGRPLLAVPRISGTTTGAPAGQAMRPAAKVLE